MLTASAEAKLNLVLEVLGRREDGYHELSGIAQTIALHDTLSFEDADSVQLTCTEPTLARDNLVEHAARLLKSRHAPQRGVHIHLQKRIPWGAGLGGGSSDAASTLLALNTLWQLNLSMEDLIGMAHSLGTDVPLFLRGGTVMLRGTGDTVSSIPALPLTYLVLVIPHTTQIQRKTALLYQRLQPSHFTRGQFVNAALFSLGKGRRIPEDLIFNVFEKVAFDFFPGLQDIRMDFEKLMGEVVHLTGSGPCLFSLCESETRAQEAATRLRSLGYTACVTHTTDTHN
ncbi:MAG: 4-(cytidine 5'-diphospho)-2-C-methyl-D-erythritol kinase [Dehalococcoidia bacterium]|nr:4-(cytidine 5'-diphospho)-2-C-methyl-D-erythritol kinase [Dehalococcoidia bacterium]